MRIGWLADAHSGYKGGAELCSEELIRSAPSDVEIVPMSSGAVHNNVDCFVIHNCTEYGSYIIPMLETRPVIKQVHDVWPHGDPVLKAWLSKYSVLVILSSPLHRESLSIEIKAPVKLLPNAIDLNQFIQAGEMGKHELEACWIGRFELGKGIETAAEWATENNCTLDFYGFGSGLEVARVYGNFCGKLRADEVAEVMAKYKTFVFLPDDVEPFGRVVVEAWAAGCAVVTDASKVGAVWWLENHPEAVERGAEMFWNTVKEVVNGG